MALASSSRTAAPQAVRARPLDDREPAAHGLNLLDLGPLIDPGRAWCLARTASSASASAADVVAEELGGSGDALLELMRQTLAPMASDHPSSGVATNSSASSPQSTSLSVVNGPAERLTWDGNGAAWTRGAELVRSFVFEPEERVAAAAFASFSPQCQPADHLGRLAGSVKERTPSERPVPSPQPAAPVRSRPSQVRRSSHARGPRLSEGASFVRQPADSSAFLSAPRSSTLLPSASDASHNSGSTSPASELRRLTSDPQMRALCFLFGDSLHLYLASGARHILCLPCPMESWLQAIECGGCALRSRRPASDVTSGKGGSLYVVRHPLDGIVLVNSDDEDSIFSAELAVPVAGGSLPGCSSDEVAVELQLNSEHLAAHASQTTVRIPIDSAIARPAIPALFGSDVEILDRQARVPGNDRLDLLIRDCLQALNGVLPARTLSALRLDLIRSADHERASSDMPARFASFSSALLDVLASDQSKTAPDSAFGLSPWERIARLNGLSRDPALQTLAPLPLSTALATSNLNSTSTADAAQTASIVLALHLLAEEIRLDILRFQDLRTLGGLVAQLSLTIGRFDWADYWFRQGCPAPSEVTHVGHVVDTSLPSPPDIYAHLRAVLSGCSSSWLSVASIPRSPPSLSSTLIDLYEILRTVSPDSAADRSAEAINLMADRGLTKERLLRIPFGLALPLMAAVKTCQSAPVASWSPAVAKLIRRPDLGRPSYTAAPTPRALVSKLISTRSLSRPSKKAVSGLPAESILDFRFDKDRRLEEVERLLSTTRVSTFKLRDEGGKSEEEITAQQKAQASMLVARTLALPVGQGMFTYATSTAVGTCALVIRPIETAVRTVRGGGIQAVALPSLEPETTTWPDFANGVAQALQIRADSTGIDSSWIVYNKPRNLTASHGGFLLGLGLTGHLSTMMLYHTYPYMDARHETTSVGLLLGLAASNLASRDPTLTKVMALHVHALLPHGSRELHSTPLVQAAALGGIGLLYLGSGERRMAEVALSEIARQGSDEDAPTEAQAYAFAAAMAFGMVMLGRGGETTRSGDPLLVSRLRASIDGRTAASEDGRSGLAQGPTSSRPVKPDLNVTSAPATLALGLMYLRTGRQEIAAILEISQSASDLQLVRPDLLFVRTLGRSLILWEEIADSETWIDSNLPAFLRTSLGKRQRDGSSVGAQQTLDLARFNILAGACFALALKYAGTARSSVHSLLLSTYDVFYARATVNASTFQQRIRLNAARSCLCVIALSLAIVMAGTGELSVLSRLRLAHGQHERFGYGVQQAVHMSLGLLFLGKGLATVGNSSTAVAAMVCAFYPSFSIGPGDNVSFPQAFRHLWALAVEPRYLFARDVESREPVYLPIKVKTREKNAAGSHSLMSPTLLPPLDRLISISIDSKRYWPLKIDLRQTTGRSPVVLDQHRPLEGILVKRRLGYLSYADDHKGNRTILAKAGLSTGVMTGLPDLGSMSVAPIAREGLAGLRQSVAAYTSDPFLLAFVRRLCAPSSSAPGPSQDLQQFCESVLLECLVNDQPHLIALYLHVRHVGRRSTAAPHLLPAVQMQNLQLALDYSDGWAAGSSINNGQQSTTLLRRSFLRETTEAMTAAFLPSLNGGLREHLHRYLGDVGSLPAAATPRDELALYLTSAGVPPLPVLAGLRTVVLEARAHLGGQAGVGGQEQDAVLRLTVKATLGRLRDADHTKKSCQPGESDLGWVDAALDVWR